LAALFVFDVCLVDAVHLLEFGTNFVHYLGVARIESDVALEETILAFDMDIDDVARTYFSDNVGDGIEQTLCVDAGKFDGS
jgi:hypothetical protein